MTIASFKRFMGTNKTLKLDKQFFRTEELSSLVLKSLKEDAKAFLYEPIEEEVITLPAHFNAIQRQATKNAAEMAGLKVSRLLNEPTAAGLAYNLQDKPDDTNFLIFDLGAGTLTFRFSTISMAWCKFRRVRAIISSAAKISCRLFSNIS